MSVEDAASNILARLRQMRQMWEDAANAYFDPMRFQLALQSCVTISRTVTFIVQSNKREIDGFDTWYESYRVKLGKDPIMKWAQDARNRVEKQGDLTTHSQVKATIVASYLDGPATDWVSEALFASPQDILRASPRKFLAIPQVREHGTLVIARRWVDSELPEMEILEALAHVYSQFVELVLDLLARSKLSVPRDVMEILPPSMQPLTMDRAVYISISDGTEIGLRLFPRLAGEIDERTLRRRYKNAVSWNRLRDVKSFDELCKIYFTNACAIMRRDNYHRAIAILFKGIAMTQVINMDHPTRALRYVIIRELAALAKATGADGVILLAEAWTAKKEDVPPSGYAVEAKNRGEALCLSAANAYGKCYCASAEIIRKKNKKHKVKTLKVSPVNEEAFIFITAPFQQEWGCLDMKEVEKSIAIMDD